MIGLLVRSVVLAAFAGGGWLAACVYPPPEALIARINPNLIEERARALGARAMDAALRAGHMITVERISVSEMMESADSAFEIAPRQAAAAAAASAAAAQAQSPFETALSLCPGLSVSNAPPADAARALSNYAPIVNVNGVALAVNPTLGACLSSGFGPRGARTHRGVDYHSQVGGPVMAAASGAIVEMLYRDDFGNMLLIDHGAGVFTRYAHLATFQQGLTVGSRVSAGDRIGLMGNTASYPLPIHLHYEVLRGDYANPRRSFGLEAASPFAFPAAREG